MPLPLHVRASPVLLIPPANYDRKLTRFLSLPTENPWVWRYEGTRTSTPGPQLRSAYSQRTSTGFQSDSWYIGRWSHQSIVASM